MKKLISVLLLGLIITSVVSSCEGSKYSVLRSGKSELYSISCVSVPFLKDNPDWDIVEELEKDSYDRIMFKCSSNSKMLYDYCGEKIHAIVICQKYDNEYSYYYDNYSFVYLENNGSISDKSIETLKSWNDWNQPLDESKMSKVENTIYPFSEYNMYKENDLIDDISQYLSKSQDTKNTDIKYDLDLFSLDYYKRGLFVIREYNINKSKYVFYNSYFVVCDENYDIMLKNGKPCILKIEDIVNCQDDLKTIKEQYNWNEPR